MPLAVRGAHLEPLAIDMEKNLVRNRNTRSPRKPRLAIFSGTRTLKNYKNPTIVRYSTFPNNWQLPLFDFFRSLKLR